MPLAAWPAFRTAGGQHPTGVSCFLSKEHTPQRKGTVTPLMLVRACSWALSTRLIHLSAQEGPFEPPRARLCS